MTLRMRYPISNSPKTLSMSPCLATALPAARLRVAGDMLAELFSQQLRQMIDRNGETDSRRLGQDRFLRPFDKNHIDNPDNLSALRIQQWPAAVTGIRRSVELINVEYSAFQLTNHAFVELL